MNHILSITSFIALFLWQYTFLFVYHTADDDFNSTIEYNYTEEEILESTTIISTTATTTECKSDASYRYVLGNIFYHDGAWSDAPNHDVTQLFQQANDAFPGSLGTKYLSISQGVAGSARLLNQIIQQELYNVTKLQRSNESIHPLQLQQRQQPSYSIWHLRLGDNMKEESWFSQSNFNMGHQAPRSKEFYESLLGYKDFIGGRVVLMGSYCSGGWRVKPDMVQRGREYVSKLRDLLQDNGIEVIDRISYSGADRYDVVDDDVKMVVKHASSFVYSAGTFSRMLGQLVQENGGVTFAPLGWDIWSDRCESCKDDGCTICK